MPKLRVRLRERKEEIEGCKNKKRRQRRRGRKEKKKKKKKDLRWWTKRNEMTDDRL